MCVCFMGPGGTGKRRALHLQMSEEVAGANKAEDTTIGAVNAHNRAGKI